MGRAPDYIFGGNIDACHPHPITGVVHFAADINFIGALTIYQANTAGGSALAITPGTLREIASDYNERRDVAPVPLVLGIPKVDDPAYGWVAWLEATGDKLTADLGSVWPEVAKAIQSGQRGRVDADFYPPWDKANPVPGRWSLRRVTIFGLDDLKVPPLPTPVITPQDRPSSPAASPSSPAALRQQVARAPSVKDAASPEMFDGLNIPRGFDADPDQAELYAHILRIQRKMSVTFAEAVTIAAKGTGTRAL